MVSAFPTNRKIHNPSERKFTGLLLRCFQKTKVSGSKKKRKQNKMMLLSKSKEAHCISVVPMVSINTSLELHPI